MESEAGCSAATAAAIADPAPPAPTSMTRLPARSMPPPAERFDATDAIEDVAAPAAVAPAPEGVDHTERARLRAERVGEHGGARLVGNREHQSAEIAQAKDAWQHVVEIGGQYVHGNENRIVAAARHLARDHLRRSHLLDRIADDA
jgi:hypothetical protein